MKSSSLKGYVPHTTFVMAKRPQAVLAQVSPEEHESLEDTVSASISIPASGSTATTHTVRAASSAELIFVEAAPSLSGASTELLHKMIGAMGVQLNKTLITDLAQADLSNYAGKVVVALGDEAAQKILNVNSPLSALRAKVHFLKNGPKVIATYHPSFLIQTPGAKKDAWEDLKLAMRELSVNSAR